MESLLNCEPFGLKHTEGPALEPHCRKFTFGKEGVKINKSSLDFDNLFKMSND